jgi:ABC-2 type transport system ATP-binding protein
MRRRLDLAMTLGGNPSVVFLDEPTTGLDPRSRRTMGQIIRELVDDAVTILLTTQYLDEADQLADRVAVLDQGRIVAKGTPEGITNRFRTMAITRRCRSSPATSSESCCRRSPSWRS